VKIAPIVREMAAHAGLSQMLVHTGQHYDDALSQVFFDELDLPRPDVNLGIGSGSHAEQTARIMLAFEPLLERARPDWVVVVGDVNSTLACALTAAKLAVPIAHVEAGLRSFDRTMPEEYNRLLTDQMATLLFTHSRSADENLAREGIPRERIHFVGNVMVDTLVRLLPRIERRTILADLGLSESHNGAYVLVTLHRPSNVDDPVTLRGIVDALRAIGETAPVVFPVHPRTRARLERMDVPAGTNGALRILEPLGYLDFLALERRAAVVVTDSGGVQEETTFLGVPCLTVRPNTERPVTVAQGTNRLVPAEPASLAGAVQSVLERRGKPAGPPPELWDGRAASRIVDVLLRTAGSATPAPVASF